MYFWQQRKKRIPVSINVVRSNVNGPFCVFCSDAGALFSDMKGTRRRPSISNWSSVRNKSEVWKPTAKRWDNIYINTSVSSLNCADFASTAAATAHSDTARIFIENTLLIPLWQIHTFFQTPLYNPERLQVLHCITETTRVVAQWDLMAPVVIKPMSAKGFRFLTDP